MPRSSVNTKLVPPSSHPPPPTPLPAPHPLSHCQQLSLITTRTQYRGGSFSPRTIRDWNSVTLQGVEATTGDTFVSRASHWPVTELAFCFWERERERMRKWTACDGVNLISKDLWELKLLDVGLCAENHLKCRNSKTWLWASKEKRRGNLNDD